MILGGPKTVNFILMDGGVGDHVSSIIALKYITTKYTNISPRVYVPDYFLEFTKHFLPNSKVYSYSQMKFNYDSNLPTKTTKWDGIISPMKIHCTDYAFLKLCDENPDIAHKNFPQIDPSKIDLSKFDPLPDKYTVITTGHTVAVREWKADYVNKVTEFCINKGYTPVFIGQTSTKTGGRFTIKGKFDASINFDQGINLIDKTSLLEAAKIMSNAAAVVGVDNGLLHVAGCTDVPIVGGFTTVDPKARMAIRKNVLGYNYYPIVPEQDLKCKFCQSDTNFIYNHNYVSCFTKTLDCVKQMHYSKFIEALEKIL